ncbi:MAG: RagB/SusD family nutrient uptake outer membrane protein [Bacteroidetes bacterium]|nr:RagB/SusD family nutrient uptake outer membrane protein [Bacteroidota bacterium]
MKVKNISLLICAITLLILSSCKKDFLDRQPLSNITPDNYLNEESQLASYAINQYSVFPTHGNWSFGTFGIDGNTDNQINPNYDNRFVPGQWKTGQTGGDWSFTSIYQCNYFLQTVLPRLKAGTISGSTDNIKHYIGEMYLIRAFVYFTKLQALGDFPIIKKTFPDQKEPLIAASKRAPQNEVARFIISDLDSATLLLKSTAPDGKKNRLSKACAQLLKSRVALYEGTWLKYFKGTAFVPNGPNWPGATKDYNASYKFPSGTIDTEIDYFLTQAMDAGKAVADATPLVTNNQVLQQTTGDAVNPYFSMFSDVDMSKYSEVLLWRQYDKGLGIVHNVPVYAQLGNDAVGLTRGMVDGFVMANGLPIYAAGSGYAGDDSLTLVRKNRDGRLWLFLKEPKQINVLYPSILGDHATAVEPIPDILNSSWEQKYSTGYTIRKGLNYDAAQCGNGAGYTGSIVFRAVEAYLNYMEACYEKNGNLDATAQVYWRAIRTRAGVDPNYQKTIDATDLSKEAANDWGVYSAGTMVDKVLYNIRRERRCELMAEGLRQMDLRRWRAMDQLISTPYHIEGFKLWGPMQKWYKASALTYGIGDKSTVSAPTLSLYLRPFEKTTTSLAYNGLKWTMAHYLNPIAIQHFMLTTDGTDLSKSPIYQNPGWPLTPNAAPIGF